jgi:hypothetical protein
VIEADVGHKEGCSFLKKRTKKLLRVGVRAGQAEARKVVRALEQKFFASFFQKRRLSLSFLLILKPVPR